MTATDELRRLLDERGVEWETDRSGNRVMWGRPVDQFHDTMEFKAVDNAMPNGGLNVHICGFTPAQAIEATLGSCNCSNSERTNDTDATLGRGACQFVWSLADNGWADHTCSACGYVENTDVHVSLDWHYCPNCGRKVEQ